MSDKLKYIFIVLITLVVIVLGLCIGSVYISPSEVYKIIFSKFFRLDLQNVKAVNIGIIWSMRFPRVIVAFIVGGILSVSGTVMQSVLKNTLASSYTMGVSSGSAFGVGLYIFLGLPLTFLGNFTLPLVGLVFGIATVMLSISFVSKIDFSMSNSSILLVGMVFSLFINACITLLSSLSGETLERMVYWQMGSFALKDWSVSLTLLPIFIIGSLIIYSLSLELDNLTFGESAAFVTGIDVKKVKWILLSLSSALTGCAVSLVGIVGFVDLITPHITRKIFGASHKKVLPMSIFIGGSFMVVADIVARTIVSPSELPIGAVTAMIGAPFFLYIYFNTRTKSSNQNA